MQLKNPIHPEVVLGRRGNPLAIRIYQELLRDVTVEQEGVLIKGFAADYLEKDQNLLEHIIICKLYKQKGKAFYIPKPFVKALSEVDRALPVSALPDRFLGYFQFGEDSIRDEMDWVDGGYVYIGPADEIGLKVLDGPKDSKIAAVSYVNRPRETGASGVGRFTFKLDNKKIGELSPLDWNDVLVFQHNLSREEVEKARIPVFRALLNAAIYVHSSDPTLVRLPAEQELSNKKRAELRNRTGAENLCTVPVTLLNKDYHFERSYSVDSTTVRGHLRWQPCGAGRAQTRLIWIDEHERNYN